MLWTLAHCFFVFFCFFLVYCIYMCGSFKCFMHLSPLHQWIYSAPITTGVLDHRCITWVDSSSKCTKTRFQSGLCPDQLEVGEHTKTRPRSSWLRRGTLLSILVPSLVSDIAVFVLKRDVKLQPTNLVPSTLSMFASAYRAIGLGLLTSI